MAIERTGPMKWLLTGKHAQRAAPVFLLGMLGMTVVAFMSVYFTVDGVAGFTGAPFVLVLLAWLLLCGSITLNGKRIAAAPEAVGSTLNLVALSVATYHFLSQDQWPGYLLAVFGVMALVSWAKKLRHRLAAPRG